MAGDDPRMQGFGWVTSYLTVKSAEETLEFYKRAFGFERGNTMPGPDGKIQHAEMKHKGQVVVMFGPEGALGGTGKAPVSSGTEASFNLYVYVDDPDALYTRATQAGATSLVAPQDMFWGDRMAQVQDVNGYKWNIARNVAAFDPAKMEQGSS